MIYELDHLFICASAGAPEAEHLIQFGLTEGTPNSHPGQGTANRRFFFLNAMLELIWVQDSRETKSKEVRRTHLWERWTGRGSGACPFGFCFRPAIQSLPKAPFPTWEYHPPYLPELLSVSIGTNSDHITEPMLFYLASGCRPDALSQARSQRMIHPAGIHEITRIHLVSPHTETCSSELRVILDSALADCSRGSEYRLEIGFDGEAEGRRIDFQPALPLIFRW